MRKSAIPSVIVANVGLMFRPPSSEELGANLPVQSETVTMYGLTFVANKVGKVVTISFSGTVADGISETDYNDIPFVTNVASPFGRLQFKLEHGFLTTRDGSAICIAGIKTGDSFPLAVVNGNINHVTFITYKQELGDIEPLKMCKYLKRYYFSTEYNTGIDVNAGNSGRCLICLSSLHVDAGDATRAQLDVIRFGYSGNFIQVTNVVTMGRTINFSVVDGKLFLHAVDGADGVPISCLFLTNKPLQ